MKGEDPEERRKIVMVEEERGGGRYDIGVSRNVEEGSTQYRGMRRGV